MARKSKAFSELRRIEQTSQKQLDSLEKKLRDESFPFDDLVRSPAGQVKMSEVLEDFIEPYCEGCETQEFIEKLMSLAIVAWNASLLPVLEQEEMINECLTDDAVGKDQQLKADLKKFIEELIDRKNRYFSQHTRMIIDFDLKDMGDSYHLSVVATLDD